MRVWFGSWRALSQVRHRLWQRRKTSSNSPAAEGPEPPNGFLFNEKPLLPGEKRVKEYWENIWVYGMGFNFLLMLIVAVFKPDTSVSSWAREKARERLSEAEKTAIALTQVPSDSGSQDDDS